MTRFPAPSRSDAELLASIRALKAELGAVVMAHNYMPAEIIDTIADVSGDSLALAIAATKAEADVIVLAGVRFMAETAKLLNPEKTVLLPASDAGCSLAESITAEDVRGLRAQYPGVPVVTYVNTTAAVKAEADICCTSANAVRVVESLGAPRVLLIPDKYLAANVDAQTDVEIITWPGRCEVHEEFTTEDLDAVRDAHADAVVLAHPECRPEVVKAADFCGSTTAMSSYVVERKPRRVALITECTMRNNLAATHPDVQFMGPCDYCPHMRRVTLERIDAALRHQREVIEVDAQLAARARRSLDAMLAL